MESPSAIVSQVVVAPTITSSQVVPDSMLSFTNGGSLFAQVSLPILGYDSRTIIMEGTLFSAKKFYLHGEQIRLDLALTNVSNKQIEFGEDPFTVALVETSAGVRQRFAATIPKIDSMIVIPNQTIEFSATLFPTSPPLRIGRYSISTQTTFVYEGYRNSQNINNTGLYPLSIFVEPTQGILQRKVILNKENEYQGTRITLSEVEFSREGTTVHVLVIPANYDAYPAMGVPGPYFVEGWYSIDDGDYKYAGSAAGSRSKEGIPVQWRLDPIPSDSKTFRFSVTSFERRSGEWNWTLDLSAK